MWKQAYCWKRGKTQETRLGLRLAVVCICVVQKVACVWPTNHRGKWSKTIVFTFDTAKNNFQPGVERNPGLHKFLLHLALWLSQKTSAIFSTNEMQNYYQSWLRHPRFSRACGSLPVFSMSSQWLIMTLSYHFSTHLQRATLGKELLQWFLKENLVCSFQWS